MIANQGTPEEKIEFLKKGGMKYLQEISAEKAKEIADRVREYENTLDKQLKQHKELLEIREKIKNGVVVDLPMPEKLSTPNLGLKPLNEFAERFIPVNVGYSPTPLAIY